MAINEEEKIVYEDPKQYEDRVSIANACAVNLGIELPALVDTIDNSTEAAYTAWPDRLYIVGRDGHIKFKSKAGPFGFKTDALAEGLAQELASQNQEPSKQKAK
jgi:type I thyroxine 5'-deiodinase